MPRVHAFVVCLPLALLSACATPQQQCINRSTKEIRTLDRLIADTRATLSRGYGYQTETRTDWEWNICDQFKDANGQLRSQMCWEPVDQTVQRPVAIDPQTEERKLQGLEQRRAALAKAAEKQVAYCKATYPE